ncbi:olfactory receptor 8D2-like [Trichechus inunguis]
MARQNDSTVTEFVLEGLTERPELQLPLFLLFLGIYGVTVMGNLCMILLITFISKLQSPMYFFLGNLSFLNLFYSSVVTTKLLENFVWEKNVISSPGCLSCSSTYINEILVIIGGGFNTLVTTVAIIVSYAFIPSHILQIPSSESRSKAFSTCGSHLTVVGVLHGSMIFMYLKPASSSNMAQEKVASVFYTTVIPVLNPLIYSLRNKDVKNVLSKVMHMRCGSPQGSSQNH